VTKKASKNKIADSQDFTDLLNRAVAEIIVKDELVELLRSGKKLRLKFGLDPSAPDLTLGHTVVFRKLRQFQELGHKVILIVGDWTAQIGDPSGVSQTRKMLSAEQVKTNAETYMQQFFMVVDKRNTEIRWQSEWFGEFDLADVVRLTSKFTVAQFLARDDFNKRFKENKPIAITELLYPLLQAYDSVAIESDVEFGGTDQKFNLLVGRELQSMMGQKPQQVFMVPLLVGTDGTLKMSKSLGNYIGIAELPENIYGKVMSIPDGIIMQYFELLTDISDKELKELKRQLAGDANPMSLKKRLARELVAQFHSEKEAGEAEEHFEKTVQKKEIPDDITEIKITDELLKKIRVKTLEEKGLITSIRDVGKPETEEWFISVPLLLYEIKLANSRSDANRLLAQGAVSVDGKKIDIVADPNILKYGFPLKVGSIIKVGKRRFVKIVFR
jgi:tyrosyl-tRNA synthetase